MTIDHDHRLTFDRACEHLESLKREIQGFLATQPYGTVSELNPKASEYTLRAVVRHEPPARLRVIIGDVVSNLRASLNQLACLLATDPVTGEAPRGTEFPIFTDRNDFHRVSKKGDPVQGSGLFKVRGMSAAVQTVIDGLQPYDRPDQDLWILHRLRIRYEHERHIVVGNVPSGASLQIGNSQGVDLYIHHVGMDVTTGPFQNGTPLARFNVSISGPNPHMDMYLKTSFGIAFSKEGPGRGRPVVECVASLCDTIRDEVFPQLEVFI